jgi:hypothetical protein
VRISIREAAPAYLEEVREFLEERGMRPVARLGELLDPLDDAALLAEDRGADLLGVLTYRIDALRFYQRRGFRLAELHAGAVDRSRATLKPSIPEIGDHGIPIRDELVMERSLSPGTSRSSK